METTSFDLFAISETSSNDPRNLLNQPPKQIQLNYLSRSANEEQNKNKLLTEDG